ncbi:uncharacterized protein SCHCODRAFT_02626863 [Schizophyllum commune H4-8]|uniref:uncharacterized protein n=1 Tax=Schizophyllum commune (strain H4-8 / FGSC 9210) TaxID=578458 RepID=UPI00215DFBF7|nr:uncharacterized protein SCHCODRAFT_02626863 [Schizophyllum commune H4-8]KAI5892691.1 hypothetical protein SCHCODRAFT_02626863 [Schizophyllum commune H4-8]
MSMPIVGARGGAFSFRHSLSPSPFPVAATSPSRPPPRRGPLASLLTPRPSSRSPHPSSLRPHPPRPALPSTARRLRHHFPCPLSRHPSLLSHPSSPRASRFRPPGLFPHRARSRSRQSRRPPRPSGADARLIQQCRRATRPTV